MCTTIVSNLPRGSESYEEATCFLQIMELVVLYLVVIETIVIHNITTEAGRSMD